MDDYKDIYIRSKNITVRVPASKSEEEIKQLISDNWDKLPDKRMSLGEWIGHRLAGGYETAVSPDWSLKQTAKEAGKSAVEALAYGTPLGRAVTFGIPFASQALSGAVSIPAGIAGGIYGLAKGKEFLPSALETATGVIEKAHEAVSAIPVAGRPISPVGEAVHKGLELIPKGIEKGIGLAQKATKGYKEPSAEILRTAAAELGNYAIFGILASKGGEAAYKVKEAVINKYFPAKQKVLDLPSEMYQQAYTDFRDFIAKNNLDISTPESRSFAVKSYNDVLKVQRAIAKESAKQAKKAMADPEIKQAAEAVRTGRMTLDDWRDLKEFKKREYTYSLFEEALEQGRIAKEEAASIKQELIEQLKYRPEEPEAKKPIKEAPEERKARLERERLEEIRQELIRQAEEQKTALERPEKLKGLQEQLKVIDRRLKEKYTSPETSQLFTGRSIEYRFHPDTRAGEFYDHLVGNGFTKERAEQIVNTVYPEAPKIEVVRAYRARETVKPETLSAEVKTEVKPEAKPEPEPVKSEPAKSKLAEPESVKPELVKPELAEPEPIKLEIKPAEPPVEPAPETASGRGAKTGKKQQKLSSFSSEELKQVQTLKEPLNRSEYIDSLSSTSTPAIEQVRKAEAKIKGKKSKLPDFKDIINNEKGELILGYRSIENVLKDLGATYKQLPEPLQFFKGNLGAVRKKIMLNSTIARLFPHVSEHMDILDMIERLPNKYRFEEYKALQPFFTLKEPEKVYQFIEGLRKQGKKRSEYPLTDEILVLQGFTEAERQAIKAVDRFTHKAMDFYVRKTLLNHARLDGGYDKPTSYLEAVELIKYLTKKNESPHIIAQAKAIQKIHEKVDAYTDHYYFPASRYGKYYVLAKTPEGDTAYLAHTNKKLETAELVRKLKQENPNWDISVGENYKPKMELAYELPPHILSVIKSAIEDLDRAGALTVTGKDLMIELERMSSKWKGSFAVHLLEADLIPGWHKNLKKNFADYTHKLTKNYVYSEYIPKFRKAMAKLNPYDDAPLIDILNSTFKDIISSQYKLKWLNKFMFLYYLSGNIKSALINLTQPAAITYPWTLRYISPTTASRIFGRAYKDAINYRTGKFDRIDPELKSIMDELIKREELIAQGVKEMMGYRESISGLRTAGQSVLEFLAIPFKEAEILNRYHAASTFYHIAKKKNIPKLELLKFVEQGIKDTQFDYSTMGLPQIARGALRPMFIFRLFAINWLSRARQLLRERNYKAFAGLIAMHFILGGLTGVPFAVEIAKAIHWAYNKLSDKEEAFEVDLRKMLKEASEEYGDYLADFMMYGLPGTFSVTIGGALNPVETSSVLDSKNITYEIMRTVTGVVPDIAIRAQRAYSIWKKHENAYRTVETVMPEFVRNMMVAYRWYSEKGATMPSGELVFTPKLYEIALKSLGLQPTQYISQLSKKEIIREQLEEHKTKATTINEKLGLALAKGDMDTFTRTIEAVIAHNIKCMENNQPERMIIPDDNAVKTHMMKIISPEAYQMKKVPKIMAPQIREIEQVYARP